MDGWECHCTALAMRLPIGKMRMPRYCRHTGLSAELRADDRITHEKEGSGSSSTETISCQVTEAPVGMDEEYHELALRVESHHIGGVQRSEQVAGHVEQDYWPAG